MEITEELGGEARESAAIRQEIFAVPGAAL